MSTATMTSKGQITIPKDVREEMGLTPGTTVTFTRNESGDYVLTTRRHSVLDLFGTLRGDGLPATLDDMDEAIAAAAGESMP